MRTVKPDLFNQKIKSHALRINVLPDKKSLILEHVRIVPSTRIARQTIKSVFMKIANSRRKSNPMENVEDADHMSIQPSLDIKLILLTARN